MEKLKRFNKSNKKNIMPFVALCVIVAVVSAAISYAVYQKEDEVLFINAKVGEFETTSSDIELAMTLDGEDIDVPPSKGYYNVTIECDHATGNWDMDEWLAKIGNITSNRVKCNVNFETVSTRPLSIVEVGDYISMTPTSTSYTIPTSLTGYSSNQTINPSELNLWRVIRKNDDGTVDVVSEHTSSVAIQFYGSSGYMNFVGRLNEIATQYTNEKYVSKTRHMGYSNQIEKCSSVPACLEDTGYTTDVNLVQTALKTLVAKTPSGLASRYCLASRNVAGTGNKYYRIRAILESGALENDNWMTQSNGEQRTNGGYIRPILTLKSDIEIVTGDGKSANTSYYLY